MKLLPPDWEPHRTEFSPLAKHCGTDSKYLRILQPSQFVAVVVVQNITVQAYMFKYMDGSGVPNQEGKERIWFLVVHHLVEDKDWKIGIEG